MGEYSRMMKTTLSTILLMCSLWGLWDTARHGHEVRNGYYDPPFPIYSILKYTHYDLTWYAAGDLLVVMGILSFLLYASIIKEVMDERDMYQAEIAKRDSEEKELYKTMYEQTLKLLKEKK